MTTIQYENGEKAKRRISFTLKFILWLIACGMAALAMLMKFPGSIAMIQYFPAGILGLFQEKDKSFETTLSLLGSGAFIMGWAIYIFLSVLILGATKRSVFTVAYLILCFLLALNVGGCQRVLSVHLE